MNKLTNIILSTLIGLIAFTSYADEKQEKAVAPEKTVVEYPGNFMGVMDGLRFYLGRNTAKSQRNNLTYLSVTSDPLSDKEGYREIFKDIGNNYTLDFYEYTILVKGYGMPKELKKSRREGRDITKEDQEKYNKHLIKIAEEKKSEKAKEN